MTLTARWMTDETVYWIFDIPYDQNDRKQGNRIVGTGDILDVFTSPDGNWVRTAAGFSMTSPAPCVRED